MQYYQQVSLYMGIKGGKSTLKIKVHFQVIIFKLIDNTITKFKNVYSQSPLSFRKKVTINILHVKFTDVNLVLIFPLSHPLLNFLINHWSSNQSALCWRKRDVHFNFFKKLYRIYKFFFKKLVIHMLVVSVRSTKCLGAQTNSLIIFCIQGKI